MINKTSKITILASLLVAGVVNAQEFYTCVPKKSWWKETIKESVPENKVDLSGIVQELKDLKNNTPSANDIGKAVAGAISKPAPTPQPGWKLVKKLPRYFDINLTFGKYNIKSKRNGTEFEALDEQRLYTRDCIHGKGSCVVISGHGSIDDILEIKSGDVIELYKYE